MSDASPLLLACAVCTDGDGVISERRGYVCVRDLALRGGMCVFFFRCAREHRVPEPCVERVAVLVREGELVVGGKVR